MRRRKGGRDKEKGEGNWERGSEEGSCEKRLSHSILSMLFKGEIKGNYSSRL